ncbi:MFS transporter [Pseudomonas amygdali]|uniref:MFS transporter n=1 Tax=Pseudomonas amygdali TaxID=47877 RepID=UPI000AB17D9E|nr:MFS transporter [Pseudomonas amygdali]
MSATALDSQGRERRKLVLAVSVGAALEWFYFTLFAIFALQIAVAFFPASDPLMSLLASYLALAVGFVARPLGALLMGRYADRRGRKAALTLSIMLMGAGTLIMAVCPTYEAIGWWAPLSIVVARILQGVAAGGGRSAARWPILSKRHLRTAAVYLRPANKWRKPYHSCYAV